MIKGYRLKSVGGKWYADQAGHPVEKKHAALFSTRDAAITFLWNATPNDLHWQIVAVRAAAPTWGVWAEPLYIHASFAKFINDRPLTLKEAKSLLAYHTGQNECWKYSIKRMPAPKEWCIRKTYPVSFPSKESAETAIVDNTSGFFHGGLAAWHAAPLK